MVKNYEDLNVDAKELTADDQANEDINQLKIKKMDEEYNGLVQEARTLIDEKNRLDEEYPLLMDTLTGLVGSTQGKQQKIAEMEQVYRQIISIKAQYDEI